MAERRIRIAIVDDDAAFRKALRRLLSASKLDGEAFASGQAFLDSLPSGRPDCLLLDVQMPGQTGLDVMRSLVLRGFQLPTIIITAHDDAHTRAQCLAAGVIGYLCKPVEESELLALIAKAIGSSVAPS